MADVGVTFKILGQKDSSVDKAVQQTQDQLDSLTPQQQRATTTGVNVVETALRREQALRRVTSEEQLQFLHRALQVARGNGEEEVRILERIRRTRQEAAQVKLEFDTGVAAGLGAIAAGLAAIGGKALLVAGQFEQFKAQLETVTGSAQEATEVFQKAVEFAARTPFDVRGIVAATVQLEVYGAKSEEVLPRVADLAAGMSKDISKTALVVGKALSGSLEGFESLRNEFGITTAELHKYGAVLTETGGISVRTAEELEKARTALTRIIDTKFGGAVERQAQTLQGAVSNAGDSLQNLLAKVGQDLIPVVTTAARGFSVLVDSIGKISPGIRGIAVAGAVAVAAIAGMGATAVGTTVAIAALNLQLERMSAQGVAGATAGAQVLTRILQGVTTAAGAAGRALVFLATTPVGLALTLAAAAVTSVKLQLAAAENESRRVGQALADQSHKVVDTAKTWRQYREAVIAATGAQNLFESGTTGSAERLDAIKSALEKGDPGRIAAAFQGAGLSIEDIKKQAAASKKEFLELIDAEKKLQSLQKSFDSPGSKLALTGPFAGLEKLIPEAEKFGDTFVVSADQVQTAINGITQRKGELREVFEISDGAQKKVEPFNAALEHTRTLAQGTGDALKYMLKVGDPASLQQALETVNSTLAEMTATAAKFNLPTDTRGLEQLLLDPSVVGEQKQFAETFLQLLDHQVDIQKKLAEESKREQKQRLDTLRESYAEEGELQSAAAAAEQANLEIRLAKVQGNTEAEKRVRRELREHNAKIIAQELADLKAFEAEALTAAAGSAEEEKRIRQDVRQRRKQILQEQVRDLQEGLQNEIRAGQELIEDTKNAQGSSASQVVTQMDAVIERLEEWGRANQTLLQQAPEVARQYREALQNQTKTRNREAARIPTENLAVLKQSVDDIKTGATGATEELARVNRAVELVNQVRRTGNVDAVGAENLLNQLTRERLTLEEQIAAKKRQDSAEIRALETSAQDQLISQLEARKQTGENVEQQLREARAQRLKLSLDAIEEERQAEIAAHGDVAVAERKAQLRREAVLNEEASRQFQTLQQQEQQLQSSLDKQQRIREQAQDRSNRLGGRHSPFQTFEEAFSGQGIDFSGVEQSQFGISALQHRRFLPGVGPNSLFSGVGSKGQFSGIGVDSRLRFPTAQQALDSAFRDLPIRDAATVERSGARAVGEAGREPGGPRTFNTTINVDGQFGRLSEPQIDQIVERVVMQLERKVDRRRQSRGPGAPPTFR